MSAAQPPSVPEGRYGRPATATRGPLGRGGKIAVAAALAAAVALTTWFALGYVQRSPVNHDMVGFTIVSPERIDATFQVHMSPGTTAVCTLDALAASFAQVGTVEVPVGPSDRHTSAYEVSIATSEEATTAVVHACVVDTP